MLARRWLGIFLTHRDLQRPDGRPLYAQRCTDIEWGMAQKIFYDAASSRRQFGAFDVSLAAIFCLFASDW